MNKKNILNDNFQSFITGKNHSKALQRINSTTQITPQATFGRKRLTSNNSDLGQTVGENTFQKTI